MRGDKRIALIRAGQGWPERSRSPTWRPDRGLGPARGPRAQGPPPRRTCRSHEPAVCARGFVVDTKLPLPVLECRKQSRSRDRSATNRSRGAHIRSSSRDRRARRSARNRWRERVNWREADGRTLDVRLPDRDRPPDSRADDTARGHASFLSRAGHRHEHADPGRTDAIHDRSDSDSPRGEKPVLLLPGETSPPWAREIAHQLGATIPGAEIGPLPGRATRRSMPRRT